MIEIHLSCSGRNSFDQILAKAMCSDRKRILRADRDR
jgi:hypothetical protein